MGSYRIWYLVCILGVSCSESTEPTALVTDGPPNLGERTWTGNWYAGDLHVHATGASNDTGGDSFPETIRDVATLRGLDFVVLTDHSNSTGSDPTTRDEDPALFNSGPEFPFTERAASLSSSDFLMLDGNELSPVSADMESPKGHIGCIPRPGPGFDVDAVFIDRPRGEVTGGEALSQARDAGCFTVLNHPYALAPWIAFDWTGENYDAVEVWNGGLQFDRSDFDGLKAWACDIANGHRPVLVGGSDNHRVNIEPPGEPTNPALGLPVTWVFADELSQDGIVKALDEGLTSVSDTGFPLELDVFDAKGHWLGMQGSQVSSEQVAWIRLKTAGFTADEPRRLKLFKIAAGHCDDTRLAGESLVPEPNLIEVLDLPISTGPVTHVQAFSLAPGDAIFAAILPEEPIAFLHLDIALTNALRAR